MCDLFGRLAACAPDAVVGRRDGVEVRFADWSARARAWAALARRQIGPNVALFHEDSLEFAAALLGAWQAGKTVWLAADPLPATCAALAGMVDAFWGQFPSASQPLADDDGLLLSWTAPPPEFPALVVQTSGSTGTPKAIRKQLTQLTSEVATLETQFGLLLADAEIVATVSHQHIYGLLFRVLWPLAAGRAIDARRHDYPEALAQALGCRPCVLVASPAHLKRLPPHLDWAACTQSLRAVFSSGGLLPADAAAGTRALLGRAPIEVYGSSETGGIGWRQREPGAPDGWLAFTGVEWRVGQSQQLEVLSPHVGGDGWLVLEDRAQAVDDRFELAGRVDRIVKIEEKRVSLDAVEARLLASGLALEARVVPAPQAQGRRQTLAAFVVPSPAGRELLEQGGKPALNARLRATLAEGIERVALPRRWRYLDALPVNPQGKTTQAQLLALLEPAERPRFPTVREIEIDATRMLLELTVPNDLLYFDGHFPVHPVLPGVVQVDWAIFYGRRYFAVAPAFQEIAALKFQQIIGPGAKVQLELLHDAAKQTLQFRYFSGAGAHASGRIRFSNESGSC